MLLASGVITMVMGTLIGLPALRVSGLYLALVTLMLAGAITGATLAGGWTASGALLAAALALAEAWGGLTLAFYTDWPTSFWITALSGLVYLASLAARFRSR